MAGQDQDKHAPKQSGVAEETAPISGITTTQDAYTKLLSTNPRFKKAEKSGTGYVIGAVKR